MALGDLLGLSLDGPVVSHHLKQQQQQLASTLGKSPSGGSMGGALGNEEKKAAVRLMNTVCKWLIGQLSRCYNGATHEIYK